MKRTFPPPRPVRLIRKRLLSDAASDSEFLQLARTCIQSPLSAILLSGGPLRPAHENRFSIAAWESFLSFQTKGDRCRIETHQGSFELRGNALDCLDEVSALFFPAFPLEVEPFCGGAIGYLAYDLKNSIERLPRTARDHHDLPDILLFWPQKLLVHDRLTGKLELLILSPEGDKPPCPHSEMPPVPAPSAPPRPLRVGPLHSNFTHEEYLAAVRRVRDFIREGDVYQVNLSQRCRFNFEGDAFHLWTSLFQINPAPFYAFIQAGDHQILSTSMERFLLRRGSLVETRPIKGTRKRGAVPQEDDALRLDLLQSPKDDAELSMIVDLLRNDLGRVCLPRSIRVEEHKRLETYENVHHLVSIVTGRLQEQTSYGGLLRATFPGGSITGCPKIRAMEIIDALEPHVRHVYTGAIGYLGWHGNLDLNVAIRTALLHGGTCYYSVGGGIVYDSDEEEEYQETLHKGRTLFQLVERIGKENR